MKSVNIGQTVELRGRQGLVISIQNKWDICVWFLCPPKPITKQGSRYRWVDVKDLEEKLKIEPLMLPK